MGGGRLTDEALCRRPESGGLLFLGFSAANQPHENAREKDRSPLPMRRRRLSSQGVHKDYVSYEYDYVPFNKGPNIYLLVRKP